MVKIMKISSCKTNHITNPMGFMMKRVTFSWITEDTTSKKQSAAQVKVATDPAMANIVHDSGKAANVSGLAYEAPLKLEPYTRYYWTVQVWGDSGDTAQSDTNWFETGKMSSAWQGKWITPAWTNGPQPTDKETHPYMHKKFHIPGKIKSARAYATGLGVYYMEINRKKVSNEHLQPSCNAYDSWVQAQTYDITDLLKHENNGADNAVGIMLGNGWAKGRFGLGELKEVYCDYFAFLCEIRIVLEDGNIIVIGTDDTWKCAKSPVAFSGIYDGEDYDTSQEISDFSASSLDESSWKNAKLLENYALGNVVDRLSLPIVVKKELKPISLINTPAGETVLDLGQNMVGWLRFRTNAPKGTRLKLTYSEVMQNDNFYTENLRSAKQEYYCTADGTDRIYEPLFTFYGFRFVKLEGFSDKDLTLENFIGCVIFSDMEETGSIETSDKLINKLFQNALWGQRGNFVDVPTDCPQRDERLGWTGDTQAFSGSACFNMDSYAFYAKFLHDLYEEQKGSDGMVHHFVPTLSPKETRFYNKEITGQGGACGWADCATILPWEVYLHSGDPGILRDQYDSMKDWVDWIKRRHEDGLWATGFHFGDWLALDGPGGSNPAGGTDTGFLAMCFYKFSADLTAKAAKVLNKPEDVKYYLDLSEKAKKEILDEYFTKTGRVAINTQTAHVLALHFDLVPENQRARVLTDLVALLKKSDMHLKTGFLGTPYLCRVLSSNGSPESAYEIFFQEDYPSWLYAVKLDATTIWERWNSILPDGSISDTGMNSLNHYAYGSIVEWMYRHMCGITPIESAPGFKQFLLKPEPNDKLSYAKAEVKTAMGLIKCGWTNNSDGTVTVEALVPFDTTAKIILPDGQTKDLEPGSYSFNSPRM